MLCNKSCPYQNQIWPKSHPMYSIGICPQHKVYKSYNLLTKTIFNFKDLVFHETVFPYLEKPKFRSPELSVSLPLLLDLADLPNSLELEIMSQVNNRDPLYTCDSNDDDNIHSNRDNQNL